MDEFLIILNRILNQTKLQIYKFYNKACFLFNKQITLQKMYEPLTLSKIKANDELSIRLSSLIKENSILIKDSNQLSKENMILKDKITCMQDLLLKK